MSKSIVTRAAALQAIICSDPRITCLADSIAVMVRGEVALSGPVDGVDEAAVRRLLTV